MAKKMIVLFLTLVLCLSVVAPALADETDIPTTEKPILSELSDDDLLQFLDGKDLSLEGLGSTQEETLKKVRGLIVEIEQNPDIEYFVSSQFHYFFQGLKEAVNEYYGITSETSLQPCADYGLKDSTLYSTPANMDDYNCYAYALGKTDHFYYPGCFDAVSNGTATFDNYWFDLEHSTVYNLALLVQKDLKSPLLNKPCVLISNTLPSYDSLKPGQTAICVRKGHRIDWADYDFHFMKLFSGDVWRHKPSKTAILTYNYLPDVSRNWTNEVWYQGRVYPATYVYQGDIYYILFKDSHDYVNCYTGNNYHDGKFHFYEYADICNDCLEIREGSSTWVRIQCGGPPCMNFVRLEDVAL